MTIPKGHHSITPHLVVPDAAEAIQWYTRGLGAVEVERVTLPSGKVMTLHMEVASSAVMLASEFREHGIVSPATIGGTPTVLQVYVDDVDGAWNRAISSGAIERSPLHDAMWGDRHGSLYDPFGHRWNLARHDRDVASDEVARLAAP